nr:NADH deshydrogenase subunit 1 [Odontocolon albotibiale]
MKQIYIYLMMLLIMLILVMIVVLLSVAFLTLMERKLLGYIQIRKGPNKLGLIGVLQPFSDAIKLLTKEIYLINKVNLLIYFISPIFSLILVLMMWMIYPFYTYLLVMNLGLIYLMMCLAFSVYGLLMAGWSSNSSYSLLGSLRSLAQSISYEVSLSIILLSLMLMIESFDIYNFMYFQENISFIIFMGPLAIIFFLSIMAEMNRTPFDFSEGESELVSGFNIEYMSGGFVLIFLSEYGSILMMSFLFVMFFSGGDFYSFGFYLKIMFMSFLVIWIRGTLPRFRYDLLMYLCWMMILPLSLNYMFMIYTIKFIL